MMIDLQAKQYNLAVAESAIAKKSKEEQQEQQKKEKERSWQRSLLYRPTLR